MATGDDNGDNWRLSIQKAISGLTGTVNTAGSTIMYTDWDGSQTVYTYNSTLGIYVGPQGNGPSDTLSFSSGDARWTWTDGMTRVSESYDDANGGRIISTQDTDGNAVTYTYTGNLLTKVQTTDAAGNTEYTTLTWSGNNLTQLTTTDRGGAMLSRDGYTYDSQDRLSTVTTDLSPADNAIADGDVVVTTYTYDGVSDRVASIQQSGGARLDIEYTLVGSTYRVTSLTQATAAGVTGATTLAYDTDNKITTVTDAQGNVASLIYDASGQLKQLTMPAAQSGAAQQTYVYTYDADGNVLTATDSLGAVTTYSYENGNLTLVRDSAGNTVSRTYSADNQLLTETRYAVPDPDAAGTGQSPAGPVTTRYVYDSHDHLRYVISASGEVTEYDYNSAGQQTSAIIYRANVYDLSALNPGDPLSESQLMAWVDTISDKSGATRTDTSYDFRGNVSAITTYSALNASGAGLTGQPYTVVTYIYDQAGNLLSRQTSGQANAETFQYDGLEYLGPDLVLGDLRLQRH